MIPKVTNGPLMEDTSWLNIVYLHNVEHNQQIYIKGAFLCPVEMEIILYSFHIKFQ
jgi:hypothetical protein